MSCSISCVRSYYSTFVCNISPPLSLFFEYFNCYILVVDVDALNYAERVPVPDMFRHVPLNGCRRDLFRPNSFIKSVSFVTNLCLTNVFSSTSSSYPRLGPILVRQTHQTVRFISSLKRSCVDHVRTAYFISSFYF